MGHHHGHSHDHHHGHHHTGNKKALLWSFILIATFMVVEVIGGILTNSLALLSDAGHMLSDAAALGLSFFALKLGEKKVTQNNGEPLAFSKNRSKKISLIRHLTSSVRPIPNITLTKCWSLKTRNCKAKS